VDSSTNLNRVVRTTILTVALRMCYLIREGLMPSIPDNFIDDLLARVDLHDLLGRYITLKKVGSRYMGVCPFHGDSQPSLSVTPDKGFWYCFGCHAGGDAITFIRKQENLEFVEAVRFIARVYGIEVPETVSDPHASRRRTLVDINDRSRDFFVKILKSKHGRPFREYLVARGFNKDTVLTYRVGASLPGWEHLSKYLLKEGFKEEDLVEAGVAIPGKTKGGIYDRFRGRLMIPIIDTLDRTLGFGARAMGSDEPKYINSPESPLFQKSKVLFGLNVAKGACRNTGQLIIMEGYTDVMQGHQAGVENCCAVMGTALTGEHLPLLARFAGEVVLSFDGDEAGLRATTRSLMALAGSDFTLKVLPLPAGSDPADIIKRDGAEKFRERVAAAVEASVWLFRTFGEPVRDKSLTDRLRAVEDVAEYLLAFRARPVYDELLERAAIAFNANLSALKTVLNQVEKGRRGMPRGRAAAGLEAMIRGGEEVEKVLFLSLLTHPRYLPEVRDLLAPEDFDHPLHLRLARILFQPGFALGTAEGIKRLREVSGDEDLYSYVVGLTIEHEEDVDLEDQARYTEDVLRKCLLHMVRRQYEAQCKGIQARITALKDRADATDASCNQKIRDLMRERQELEEKFGEIRCHLGADEMEEGRTIGAEQT